MKTVASYALGCKVNQYESEAIAELFTKEGFKAVDISEKADVYIINTCTVTNLGDKKSRQLIRRVKKQNPDSIVVVIGCYAQTSPEVISGIEGVNIILGTKDRGTILKKVLEYKSAAGIKNYVSKIADERSFEELKIENLKGRTRAYLKIQDGCNNFCSYCIIPYARGPIRSRRPEYILSEVNRLSKAGFKEIVLTGIHVASYGKDLEGIGLFDIIKEVSKVEGIKRIRLSSIEPNIITEDFIMAAKSTEKLCNHFHLSLQSGCNKILKAMNRRYTAEDYYKAICLLRENINDVSVTTDIIAGFPGETEEDFKETLDFARKVGFAKIHAFPYSPKEGTVAARLKGQLPNSVKSARANELIKLSNETGFNYIKSFEGKIFPVLYEMKNQDGFFEGHTSNYILVRAKSDADISNEIIETKIIKAYPDAADGLL